MRSQEVTEGDPKPRQTASRISPCPFPLRGKARKGAPSYHLHILLRHKTVIPLRHGHLNATRRFRHPSQSGTPRWAIPHRPSAPTDFVADPPSREFIRRASSPYSPARRLLRSLLTAYRSLEYPYRPMLQCFSSAAPRPRKRHSPLSALVPGSALPGAPCTSDRPPFAPCWGGMRYR